ncbi:MAG: hypothetical protein ACSLFN_07755 [Candidatus Limnocylindrales bacterium]
MFFYELHEGDAEVYSDVLVVSESEWEPQEFFDLVQRIRRDVQDHFTHDTLIESIAAALERDYGFIFVSDEQLIAAVNVSTVEEENFLADLGMEDDDDDDDDDENEEEGGDQLSGDFRTILAEFDPEGEARLN